MKKGLPSRVMLCAFSKDEHSNYLNEATKASKGIPGPGNYQNTMTWTTSNGKFTSGSKRKMFTDEAAE